MKKKLFAAISAALFASLALGLFVACGDKDDNGNTPSIEETISNHEHKYDAREIYTVCGYTENGTDGLKYGYDSDENCYYATGIGTAMDTDIIIPSVYDDGEHGKLFVGYVYQSAFSFAELTSVVMGYGVTAIQELAFFACFDLTKVSIPDSVIFISSNSFASCNSELFQTENGVQYLDKWAVDYDKSATSVTLRSNTVGIGISAFDGCSSLTSIAIPKSVVSIGKRAFYGCSSLTSISIPQNVKVIGEEAFHGCRSIERIIIPNGVTVIECGTFQGCYNLTSIVIPKTVTSIGANAFCYCGSLRSVSIPDGVTKISYYTFRDCADLTNITIPNTVEEIDVIAFAGCFNLTNIRYKGTKEEWKAIKGTNLKFLVTDCTIHCKDGKIVKVKT